METYLAKLYLFKDMFKTYVAYNSWHLFSRDVFRFIPDTSRSKSEVDAVGNFLFSLSIMAQVESAYDAS